MRSIIRTSVILSGVACLVLASLQAEAQAQRRYQPRTPTVSPYLNLTRRDSGPLPNYYTLVRPLQRQIEENQQLELSLRQQSVEIERVRTEFGQQQISPTGKAGWFNTLGPSNQFGETLHYYGRGQSLAPNRRYRR